MSKVFICYSSRDHVFTHKLVAELRRHDIEVWFDGLSLGVGDSLIQKIGDAITNADYVLAVISSNSINSEWVNRELRLALSREFMETGVKVLPLLLDRCKVPPFLLDKVYADFSDSNLFEISIDKLLDAIIPGRDGSVFDDVQLDGAVFNPATVVNDLFDELGAGELSFDQKQALMIKMTEVLLKRIFLETMEQLDDKGMEEYERLIDQGASPEEVKRFLVRKIPEYDAMVQGIVNEFKTEMKSSL